MPLGLRGGAAAASLAATGAACLLAGGAVEALLVLAAYAATLANLLMTRALAAEALFPARGRKGVDKAAVVLYSLGKAAVLLGALVAGGLYMKERVVVPLLNHAVQIFILGAGLPGGLPAGRGRRA